MNTMVTSDGDIDTFTSKGTLLASSAPPDGLASTSKSTPKPRYVDNPKKYEKQLSICNWMLWYFIFAIILNSGRIWNYGEDWLISRTIWRPLWVRSSFLQLQIELNRRRNRQSTLLSFVFPRRRPGLRLESSTYQAPLHLKLLSLLLKSGWNHQLPLSMLWRTIWIALIASVRLYSTLVSKTSRYLEEKG